MLVLTAIIDKVEKAEQQQPEPMPLGLSCTMEENDPRKNLHDEGFDDDDDDSTASKTVIS
jgi:hypothetical protein